MKTKLSSENLDQQLRRGAADRRATLDQLASAYPVGDYPPRSAERRAAATGPGVGMRMVWLVGLGGLTTAGLVGLVTLVSLLVTPDPTRPSPSLMAAKPAPETLGTSVRSLVAGLGELEARMGQRLDPSVAAATAWPSRIDELPAVLGEAEAGLQQPIQQEFTALRADLRTAADYIRQQWRVPADAGPTGGLPPAYEATLITG
ncbi:MAG: hypothetical protein AAF086_06645 [Planctomycetota bacterium]